MSLEDLELNPDTETSKPPLEYTTHEEYTMQMEREANRKLKAGIRKRRKSSVLGIRGGGDSSPYIK